MTGERPPISLGELASRIDAELIGDPKLKVTRIVSIEHAGKGDLTFLSDPKKSPFLHKTKAGALIVPKGVSVEGKSLLIVDNPYVAFAKAQSIFYPMPRSIGNVSPLAYVHPQAHVGENVTIYPFVYVEKDVRIGDGTIVYPHVFIGEGVNVGEECIFYAGVKIYHGCHIGHRVILHSGVVIGSDGFGYAWDGKEHVKIPQVGGVVIGDNTEIGANTTVDRGTLEDTVIGSGVKIDNLVQVGHNVKVGNHSILVSQVGIAGSAEIGEEVVLAGQVGIAGHIRIGNRVKVAAQSGIHKDMKDGEVVSGSPALPYKTWLKTCAVVPRLPEMRQKLRQMEERLDRIEKELSELESKGEKHDLH